MSYFQTLSNFQDTANQIQAHQDEVQQAYADTKKQDVDDKFDFVDKVLGQSAGGLGGLGASIHGLRTTYKKYKKAKKLFQTAQEKAKEAKAKLQGKKNPSGDSQEDTEQSETTSAKNTTEQADGTEPATPAETTETQNTNPATQGNTEASTAPEADPAGSNSASTNDPTATLDDPAVNTGTLDASAQGSIPPAGRDLSYPVSQEGQGGTASFDNPATRGINNPQNIGVDSLENIPEGREPSAVSSAADEALARMNKALGRSQNVIDQFDNRTPIQASSKSAAPQTNENDPNASPKVETNNTNANPSNTSENTNNTEKSGQAQEEGNINESPSKAVAETGADDGDAAGGLSDLLKTGVKSGVEDLASTATETLTNVGTALDFLGPAGEIVGAGLGLVGLFTGLLDHSKEKEQETQVMASAQTAQQQKGGIDIANVIHSGSIGGSVGTLI